MVQPNAKMEFNMRKLSKTENANRYMKIDISKKSAVVVHAVKPNADSPVRYELTWTFDFSQVTLDNIYRLATKSLVIAVQDEFRKAPGSTDKETEAKWDNHVVNVADWLAGRRTKADPVNKAKKLIDGLTDEQLSALGLKRA